MTSGPRKTSRRRRNSISGVFAPRLIEMLGSAAYRVLASLRAAPSAASKSGTRITAAQTTASRRSLSNSSRNM
jgi:hypothetical protein